MKYWLDWHEKCVLWETIWDNWETFALWVIALGSNNLNDACMKCFVWVSEVRSLVWPRLGNTKLAWLQNCNKHIMHPNNKKKKSSLMYNNRFFSKCKFINIIQPFSLSAWQCERVKMYCDGCYRGQRTVGSHKQSLLPFCNLPIHLLEVSSLPLSLSLPPSLSVCLALFLFLLLSVLPVFLLERPLLCPGIEIRKWRGQVYHCR